MIFAETSANRYNVFPMTYSILTDPDYQFGDNTTRSDYDINWTSFDRLDNDACIREYGKQLVSNRGDVIAILDPESTLYLDEVSCPGGDPLTYNSYDWMCWGSSRSSLMPFPQCELPELLAYPNDWALPIWNGSAHAVTVPVQVKYCLSQKRSPHCRLLFNLPLMAIVIAFNAVKVVCMLLALFYQRETPLVTLGGKYWIGLGSILR